LDNLYDVVFMTYETNITAYSIQPSLTPYEPFLMRGGLVPHDIDWVKDRVRWYWDTKLFKDGRAQITSAATQDKPPQEKETYLSSEAAANVPPVVVTEARGETTATSSAEAVAAIAAAPKPIAATA
jgi:hypothetical protein